MKYLTLGILLVLTLSGCGTSPEPGYYALTEIPGTISPDITVTIEIERPTLPDYLDRLDRVRQTSTYQFTIDDMRRWAAPLDEMIERILAEDLRQRMPNVSLITEEDDMSFKARFILDTEIDNFHETNDGALLVAQFTTTDHSACKTGSLPHIHVHVDSHNADSMAALSELIGKLADRIVVEIVERSTLPPCATNEIK